MLLEEVTINDSEQSQQTIPQTLNLEGTPVPSALTRRPLTSYKELLFPDWDTWLEGETVTCEDMIIKLSTSLSESILEGCLTTTCDKWEWPVYQLY